jgi:hypothetical protein
MYDSEVMVLCNKKSKNGRRTVKTSFSPKKKVAARQLFFGGCNASEKNDDAMQVKKNDFAHYFSFFLLS